METKDRMRRLMEYRRTLSEIDHFLREEHLIAMGRVEAIRQDLDRIIREAAPPLEIVGEEGGKDSARPPAYRPVIQPLPSVFEGVTVCRMNGKVMLLHRATGMRAGVRMVELLRWALDHNGTITKEFFVHIHRTHPEWKRRRDGLYRVTLNRQVVPAFDVVWVGETSRYWRLKPDLADAARQVVDAWDAL